MFTKQDKRKCKCLSEVLISATAGVVVKFLLEQVEKYIKRKGKKTKEMGELKNTLEPFKERLEVNEAELKKIKAIATTSKPNLMDFEFSKAEFFHSVESAIAAPDISIVAKEMKEVPVDSWAEAICEFEVK